MSGESIHWFTYAGDGEPTPFLLVDRPWGEAAVPLSYEIENGDYRITTRENELLATVPAGDAAAQSSDLGEVMWWIDDGTHLIPMSFSAAPITN